MSKPIRDLLYFWITVKTMFALWTFYDAATGYVPRPMSAHLAAYGIEQLAVVVFFTLVATGKLVRK